MKTFKTALSLLLALCMVMSLGSVTASAGIVINRDITAEELGWVVGIGSEPDTRSFDEVGQIIPTASAGGTTVNGNVSATSCGTSPTTVRARADGIFVEGDGYDITVNGNVSATAEAEGNAYGMEISADLGCNTVVTVKGNVSAKSDSKAYGVVTGGIGNKQVNITGDVSGGTTGVNAGSGSEVTVGGDVTGTNDKGVIASGEETTVKVTGDVTGGNTGVNASASTVTVGIVNEDGTVTGDETHGNVSGGTHGVYASAGSEVIVGGDVEGTSGTGVIATDGETTVKVTGSVSGSNTGVIASSGSEVTVGGNVEGTSDTGVAASDGSKVTVGTIDEAGNFTGSKVTGGNHGIGAGGEGTTVNAGDVTSNPSGFGTGIWAHDSASVTAGDVTTNGIGVKSDGGSSVIAGDVTATGETAVAVSVTGSKVEVKNVTSKDGKGIVADNATVNADSVKAGITGVSASDDANVTVTDAVEAGQTGIAATNANVNAGSVEAGKGGVEARTIGEGVSTTVTIGIIDDDGNVVSYGDVKADGTGVFANTSVTDAKTTVNTGSIEAGDKGVEAKAIKGTTTVNVEGSVEAEETGIVAYAAQDSSVTVTVSSDVTSTNGNGIDASGSNTVVEVSGDVTSGSDGTGIKADTGSSVEVSGDVTGGTAGVKVEGAAKVTIDGTLTVTGGTPILLGDAVTESEAGNINITVWEIQGQAADGSVVSGGQEGAAKAVQKNIDYVIKVAPDETSQSVFGEYKNDDKTTHSGQQTIKVTVPEGFNLASAYATDGTEVAITKGEDGNYYATIPVGGGIYLHATLDKIPDPGPVNPDPEPKPEPKPEPEPEPKPQPEPEFVVYISVVDSIPATPAAPRAIGTDAFDEFMQAKLAAVKAAPANSVVEIDLRETGWTNLKRDIFEASATRGVVTIVIYYCQWGQDHTLTIPAGTQLNDVVSQAQYLDVTQLGTLLNLRAV